MMNRNNNHNYMREYLVGGRNFPAGLGHQHQHQHQHQHGRGQSLTGFSKDAPPDDNHLDLFSKTRRSLSVASSDDNSSDVSVKIGRLSVGSAKLARSPMDDLLSATDGGKHDYDWLLTPPGTPLFPSSNGNESRTNPIAAPRRTSMSRSVSTTKASRLSVSQSESNHSSRPARSSSVTRSSVSAYQYSSYSSNRSSCILNTSSASVSSYIRPASPSTRSTSTARPSTPSARPSSSRSSTPSRTRPSLTSSSVDRTRPSQNSRPSTPSSSRPQILANLSSTTTRSSARPTTPTCRNPTASTSPGVVPSISSGRVMSNGRNPAPTSRPSSPSPRVRPTQQPVVPPDFPLDTPPNLRTTLPDRPLSAGRSRPGAALNVKGNQEATGSVNMPRRHSSPIVSRGRLTDPPARSRASGHIPDIHESRRASNVSELSSRRPVKSLTSATDSTGFGRTISKKSLDMAIRHMDIRNGSGSIRPLSGTTLFPQSVRSATSKSHSPRTLESVSMNGSPENEEISEKGNNLSRIVEDGSDTRCRRYSAKLSEVDIYESSRYDAILLKEDLKNTNWLHGIDDKLDQGPFFDNGFEPLPEPFGPL